MSAQLFKAVTFNHNFNHKPGQAVSRDAAVSDVTVVCGWLRRGMAPLQL